jgi:tRNA pseudouridine55 synthase
MMTGTSRTSSPIADHASGAPEGAVYLLDKSGGISSRKASSAVARAWGYKRFGHAGTLDPAASGLLVVLLGRATRLSRYLTGFSKSYQFTLRLGTETDTGDETGKPVGEVQKTIAGISAASVLEVLEGFTGTFDQEVPAFSAVHVNGRRAYRGARKGMELTMPVREATAWGWKLEEHPDQDDSGFRLEVKVGSGTYVRALARDIGRALGVGAHAEAIRRTMVGHLSVLEASLEPDNADSLRSMAESVSAFDQEPLDDTAVRDIRHGRPVQSGLTGTVALLDSDGRLVAMGQGDGVIVRPECVLKGF